ncbi:CobQ/CobB/MinD/ParA nucleotide binding domain protein [Moorella thermoacetica]|uniref:CobQ/CobB/MinD/ParA nucleotide binding domain protein n=1 Tax=Neomoorella thermoacetica TaxID=1525 RepID=A0A1J5NNC4_NEOTH|nr:CobQ/CobB/MinD/ParA nucleotide binding domain protein [Moorella thermoacetica]
MKFVAVTSPATDAGKTFIACNLAAAAAERGVATALLDFDLAVGDMVRALGLEEEARRPHPTVASWKDYRDPAAAALKGPGGVAVFPRPENPFESVSRGDVEAFLNYLAGSFEAVVADAGADVGSECWGALVAAADEILLVVDCDEKAVYRTKKFLAAYHSLLENKCRLAVNQREKKSYYRPSNVIKVLNEELPFLGIITVPYSHKVARKGIMAAAADVKDPAGKSLRNLAAVIMGRSEAASIRPETDREGKNITLLKRLFWRRGRKSDTSSGTEKTGQFKPGNGEAVAKKTVHDVSEAAILHRNSLRTVEAERHAEAAPTAEEVKPAGTTRRAEAGDLETVTKTHIKADGHTMTKIVLCLGSHRIESWLVERLREKGITAVTVGPEEVENDVRPGDVVVIGRQLASRYDVLRERGAAVVLILGPSTATEAAGFRADRMIWWPADKPARAADLLAAVEETWRAARSDVLERSVKESAKDKPEILSGPSVAAVKAEGLRDSKAAEKEAAQPAETAPVGFGNPAAEAASPTYGETITTRDEAPLTPRESVAAPDREGFRADRPPKVLLFGRISQSLAARLASTGWRVISDPADGPDVVAAEAAAAALAPRGVPLVVIGADGALRQRIERSRPDAVFASGEEDVLAAMIAALHLPTADARTKNERAREKTAFTTGPALTAAGMDERPDRGLEKDGDRTAGKKENEKVGRKVPEPHIDLTAGGGARRGPVAGLEDVPAFKSREPSLVGTAGGRAKVGSTAKTPEKTVTKPNLSPVEEAEPSRVAAAAGGCPQPAEGSVITPHDAPAYKDGRIYLPRGSVLYVVSPSRPAAAGEAAVAVLRQIDGERALVCAASDSTAALEAGMKPEELVTADWRTPGSVAPVVKDGVWIWPVDPYKFLPADVGHVHSLANQIRGRFSLTAVDCGGSLSLCSGVLPHAGGILVLRSPGPGGIEGHVLSHWLRQNAGKKVLSVDVGAEIRVKTVEEGFEVCGL